MVTVAAGWALQPPKKRHSTRLHLGTRDAFPPPTTFSLLAEGEIDYLSTTTYGYLSNALDFDDDVMTRITLRYPSVLGYSVEANIRPTLAWLADTLHLEGSEVIDIVKVLPTILGLSGTS